MQDRLLGAAQRLVGALDELGPALHQHLHRDVVGDQVVVDQLADEVEVRLARRGEADLDLLEPHPDEGLEQPQLAFGVHRVDQGLVAVPQVDGAPHGRVLDAVARPLAIGKSERKRPVRLVLLERHSLGGHGMRGHRHSLSGAHTGTRSENGRTPCGCRGFDERDLGALAVT